MPRVPGSTFWFEHDGVTNSLAAWADRLGIPRSRVYRRLQLGWSPGQALELEEH